MKTRSKILLFLLFLFTIACQTSTKNDEFKKATTVVLKDIDSSTLEDIDKEKKTDSLYRSLLQLKNDSVVRNFYFKIANRYFALEKYDKYVTVVNKLNVLSVKDNDSVHIAKSLYFYGEYFEEKSQLDSAFSYYARSEKIYTKVGDTLNSGRTKLYMAGILYDAGIYSESEIEAIAALKLLLKMNHTRLVYECYNLLGIALKEQNNCLESLKYFNLALQQLKKLEKENYDRKKVVKSRIACLNNMGRVYEKLKLYPQAIRLYNKGLSTADIRGNFPKLYALLLDNLCNSKMQMGDFSEVEELLFESLKIRDSLDNAVGIASAKIALGEYYLHKKDTAKALNYFEEGLLKSKEVEGTTYTLQSLKLLMENDSRNRIKYTNQYFKLHDSVQEVERITKNKFARIAYETDQVAEKNVVLSKRNTNIIIGAGIIFLLTGVFFIIYRLKSKNRELSFIKEQQEANEKIYQLMLQQQAETEQARNDERNRIAMELHDGIVNSVFTTRFNLIQLDSNEKDRKEELVKELEKTENEIRKVSHDLIQNLQFEDKSFPEIVSNLVASQQNEYHTKFDVSVDKYIDWSAVLSSNKIHIYRILQEAIQNSSKYSKAERCYITLLKTGDKVTVRIWDNGVGFHVDMVKQGIGLRNIKERAKSLNGELKITSVIGKGTTIEVVV